MVQPDSISPELDELACEAIGASLDLLAEGGELHPTAYYAKRGGAVERAEFADDSPDACLAAARRHILGLKIGEANIYAIVYDGFVQERKDTPAFDAVIVEFGERGAACAYSASVAYAHERNGSLVYGEPAPAGEEELLLT